MTNLNPDQERLCRESPWDFSDLRALYINCTLKRSPEVSNTRGLADQSIAIMHSNGVHVDVVRAVDREIATGVYSDMTEHGWERDDWPAIDAQVIAADGCIITGNEDGAKHCAMNILYSLQHLGFTIPPQADSGWLGEAGPGSGD
jgi:hypothetical protein